MADVEKTAILKVEVDFGDLEKNQQTIASKINDIRNEQLKLDVSTKENQKTFKENAATLRVLEQQQKLNQKSINELTNAEKANTDTTNFNNNSIKQNRELLKELNAEYIRIQNPTKEQTANLKNLTDTLKKQESAIGDNRRNVGNYAEGFRDVISTIPGFTKGLDGIKLGFQAITTANPFGLIFQILQPLIASFLKLEPVTNTISGIFEGFSATITTIVSSVKNFFDLVSSGQNIFSSFGDAFSGLGSRIANAATEGFNLVQALDDLADAERANQGAIAQTNRDTAILIAQSRDRTKTEKERVALLEEANRLEEAQLKRDITLAFTREKLAAAQLATIIRNGGDRDKAEQDLADAQAARFAVQQAFGTQTEKSQGRINGLIQAEADIREKASEKRKAESEKLAIAEEKRIADLKKRAEEAVKFFNDTTKAEFEFAKQASDIFYEEQNAKLAEQLATRQITLDEYNQAVAENQNEQLQTQLIVLEDYANTVSGLEDEIARKKIEISNASTAKTIDNIKKEDAAVKKQKEDQTKLLIERQKDLNNFTTGVTANFTTALFEQGNFLKNFQKALAGTLLDILERQVTVSITAQSLAQPDSIATFGASGIARSAILLGLLKGAFAVARNALQGFAEGGYTGQGGKYDVAGVVHKNEYVVPSQLIKPFAPVIAQIESARTSGYVDGGFAGSITGEVSSIRQMATQPNLVDSGMLIQALRELNISVSVTEIAEVNNRLDLQAQVAEL